MISIATNLMVTGPLMQLTGLPIQAANAIAVVAASFANFAAADRVVFMRARRWPATARLPARCAKA